MSQPYNCPTQDEKFRKMKKFPGMEWNKEASGNDACKLSSTQKNFQWPNPNKFSPKKNPSHGATDCTGLRSTSSRTVTSPDLTCLRHS